MVTARAGGRENPVAQAGRAKENPHRDSRGSSKSRGGRAEATRSGGKRTALGDVTNTVRGDARPAARKPQLPVVQMEPPRVEPRVEPVLEVLDDSDEDLDGMEILYPGHPQYQPIDVTVKNTFIELPCTPERAGPAAVSAIAATCPAKCAITEEERQAWEEERDAALEAQALFTGVDRKIEVELDLDPSTSVGSLLHRSKLCKPCAWFHHPKGCQRGVRCEFCHCCPAGEIKRRKKEKTMLIRKRRSQRLDEPMPARVPETPEGLLQPLAIQPLPMQPLPTSGTFTAAHAQVQPFQPAYAEYEEAYGAQPGPLDYSQPTGFEMASGYEELYPNDFSTVPGFQTNSFDDCANYGGQFWG